MFEFESIGNVDDLKKLGRDLFEEWSQLNQVICDWRSRFDILREELSKCKTREEAENLLAQENFLSRYSKLPDWLQ